MNGHKFPSMVEATRYLELEFLQSAGDIQGLEVHPRIQLVGARSRRVGTYVADFRYYDRIRQATILEDVKRKTGLRCRQVDRLRRDLADLKIALARAMGHRVEVLEK